MSSMKFKLIPILAAAVFAAAPASLHACTWFRFLNDQKHSFIGRTLEWPGDLNSQITRVPRGHDFGQFKSEHGFVGVSLIFHPGRPDPPRLRLPHLEQL